MSIGDLCLEACCGCTEFLLIMIYNSNCALDDDFDITLNGHALGTITNNSNNCTGRIFAAGSSSGNPNPSRTNVNGISCGCAGDHFGTTVIFDSDFLVTGSNTLEIASINDANNGNFGTVQVGCYKWNSSSSQYELEGSFILNSTYGHAEGPPNKTTHTFTYPAP